MQNISLPEHVPNILQNMPYTSKYALHFKMCLTVVLTLNFGIPVYTNSVDPDQTPQNAASDLGRHCLSQI